MVVKIDVKPYSLSYIEFLADLFTTMRGSVKYKENDDCLYISFCDTDKNFYNANSIIESVLTNLVHFDIIDNLTIL